MIRPLRQISQLQEQLVNRLMPLVKLEVARIAGSTDQPVSASIQLISAVGSCGNLARPLLNNLIAPNQILAVRLWALQGIAAMDQPYCGRALSAIAASQADVRPGAAKLLMQTGDSAATPALLKLLTDDGISIDIRESIARNVILPDSAQAVAAVLATEAENGTPLRESLLINLAQHHAYETVSRPALNFLWRTQPQMHDALIAVKKLRARARLGEPTTHEPIKAQHRDAEDLALRDLEYRAEEGFFSRPSTTRARLARALEQRIDEQSNLPLDSERSAAIGQMVKILALLPGREADDILRKNAFHNLRVEIRRAAIVGLAARQDTSAVQPLLRDAAINVASIGTATGVEAAATAAVAITCVRSILGEGWDEFTGGATIARPKGLTDVFVQAMQGQAPGLRSVNTLRVGPVNTPRFAVPFQS